MIWSVPSSKESFIINTPLEARSIRYIYFADKNGGLLRYKTVPDCISIEVDGKQICKNVIMFPFMQSSSRNDKRHDWRSVALEVPMNIRNSEVHISGVRDNDFNIVFVLSEEPVDEKQGYDYVECRVFDYLTGGFIDDVERAPMSLERQNIIPGKPIDFTLDYAPSAFFATQVVCYGINEYEFAHDGKIHYLQANRVQDFMLTLDASDDEVLAPGTHLDLVSATDYIPMRDALYDLGRHTTRSVSLSVRVSPALPSTGSKTWHEPHSIQLYFFFLSKRIN